VESWGACWWAPGCGLWRSAELALARAISAVRVNSITTVIEGGRTLYVKTRRRGGSSVIRAGNVFLAWSKSRIAMIPRTADWLAWEAAALEALHPGVVVRARGRSLVLETLRGAPVRVDAVVDERALAAVGRELARAHRRVSAIDGRSFTHGDPHLRNFLYDGQSARLLDVETIHDADLSERDRCADDLFVVLLDAASAIPRPRRSRALATIVEHYDDCEVALAIAPRLVVPRGLERVLYATRTHYARDHELRVMLEDIARAVDRSRPRSSSPDRIVRREDPA
jgi:hypothetical protein